MAAPGMIPSMPAAMPSSMYSPPQPSRIPTRPAVADRMAMSRSIIIGSSSFTNRRLSPRSRRSAARDGPMVGPPGLKSWIRTGRGVAAATAAQ